jgi:hypothetical protein
VSILYNSFVSSFYKRRLPSTEGLLKSYIIYRLVAIKIMFEFINTVLVSFRGCFNRKATFHCFVIIILGFMVRCDYAGISSIIRTLALRPVKYESLVHFFVPARGIFQLLKNNGYVLSELPVLYSQKTECLFSLETG